jgi:hypothetical protein
VEEPEALYVRDGDGFVGTSATTGSWYASGQSGGAVLALLGHVLEDVPSLTPMSLSRLTVDIVRPVPTGERLKVETSVVREGKKIQVVELVVTTPGTEHVRARALRLRDADLRELDAMPASTTTVNPASLLPQPETVPRIGHEAGGAEFLRLAVEMRRAPERDGEEHGIWLRLLLPVVAGEPVRPTSLATLPMDCVNLIGVPLERSRATAINADVSGHVSRLPAEGWIALVGNTWFAQGVGHGTSVGWMCDADGVFGVTSTSQLVQPVG